MVNYSTIILLYLVKVVGSHIGAFFISRWMVNLHCN